MDDYGRLEIADVAVPMLWDAGPFGRVESLWVDPPEVASYMRVGAWLDGSQPTGFLWKLGTFLVRRVPKGRWIKASLPWDLAFQQENLTLPARVASWAIAKVTAPEPPKNRW